MWCQGRWWVGSYIFFSPLDSHLPATPCAHTQWICPQASSVSSWMPSFFKTFLFCHLFLQLVLPPLSSSRAPTCGAAHLQRKERVECWTSPPLLKNTSTQFDDQTSALQLQQKSFEFRMTTRLICSNEMLCLEKLFGNLLKTIWWRALSALHNLWNWRRKCFHESAKRKCGHQFNP